MLGETSDLYFVANAVTCLVKVTNHEIHNIGILKVFCSLIGAKNDMLPTNL